MLLLVRSKPSRAEIRRNDKASPAPSSGGFKRRAFTQGCENARRRPCSFCLPCLFVFLGVAPLPVHIAIIAVLSLSVAGIIRAASLVLMRVKPCRCMRGTRSAPCHSSSPRGRLGEGRGGEVRWGEEDNEMRGDGSPRCSQLNMLLLAVHLGRQGAKGEVMEAQGD